MYLAVLLLSSTFQSHAYSSEHSRNIANNLDLKETSRIRFAENFKD